MTIDEMRIYPEDMDGVEQAPVDVCHDGLYGEEEGGEDDGD